MLQRKKIQRKNTVKDRGWYVKSKLSYGMCVWIVVVVVVRGE